METNNLSPEILKTFTKQLMLDYETIRKSGVTNMFDYYTVMVYAKRFFMEELSKLTLQEYKELLWNFGRLMKYYNIIQ